MKEKFNYCLLIRDNFIKYLTHFWQDTSLTCEPCKSFCLGRTCCTIHTCIRRSRRALTPRAPTASSSAWSPSRTWRTPTRPPPVCACASLSLSWDTLGMVWIKESQDTNNKMIYITIYLLECVWFIQVRNTMPTWFSSLLRALTVCGILIYEFCKHFWRDRTSHRSHSCIH